MKWVILTGVLSGGVNFVQSLLDGHPNIGMLPGPHTTGFFSRSFLWHLAGASPLTVSALAERTVDWLAAERERGSSSNRHHGFDRMGETEDQTLPFPREAFRQNLEIEAAGLGVSFDAAGFYMAMVRAYRKAIGRPAGFSTLVFHCHAPLQTVLEASAHMGSATLVVCVRDPIQGLSSVIANHLRMLADGEDPTAMLTGIYATIMATADFLYHRTLADIPVCYVRLESLKGDPVGSTRRLADVLGIGWTETLLQSSFDGLAYHGPRNAHSRIAHPFQPNALYDDGAYLSEAEGRLFRFVFSALAQWSGASSEPVDEAEFRSILSQPLRFERLLMPDHAGGAAAHPLYGAFRDGLIGNYAAFREGVLANPGAVVVQSRT